MPDRSAIVEEILAHMNEQLPDADGPALAPDTDLVATAGFDSLAVLESLVWLEERWGLVIGDEDLVVESFSSVDKMADYVHAHLVDAANPA
jgi:acyl carrier protein